MCCPHDFARDIATGPAGGARFQERYASATRLPFTVHVGAI